MLTRRDAIKNALFGAVALVALPSLPAAAESQKLKRRIEVCTAWYDGGSVELEDWKEIDFKDLRQGDIFRMAEPMETGGEKWITPEEPGAIGWHCETAPTQSPQGDWYVQAEGFIPEPGCIYFRNTKQNFKVSFDFRAETTE